MKVRTWVWVILIILILVIGWFLVRNFFVPACGAVGNYWEYSSEFGKCIESSVPRSGCDQVPESLYISEAICMNTNYNRIKG